MSWRPRACGQSASSLLLSITASHSTKSSIYQVRTSSTYIYFFLIIIFFNQIFFYCFPRILFLVYIVFLVMSHEFLKQCKSSCMIFWCYDILIQAYIQTSRALMVSASLLGLPALALVLLAMPCVKLSQETEDTKHRRAVLGGLLILFICESLSVCLPV